MMDKKAQIGMEYIIIMGFVIILVIAILGVAYAYSGGMKDKIKSSQISNFAGKIIATSEEIYYYGEPSKATISVYLPEGVKNITISNHSIYIEASFYSGYNKIEYTSQVPLFGNITTSQGIKKVKVQASNEGVIITQ